MTLEVMKQLLVLFTMKELYEMPKHRQRFDRSIILLQGPEKYILR